MKYKITGIHFVKNKIGTVSLRKKIPLNQEIYFVVFIKIHEK